MNKATVDSVMMYVWAMRAAATEQILEPCGANIGKLEIANAALRAEVERLADQAEPAPAPKKCNRCNGTGLVSDGAIYGSGGVEYENGPVLCVKDCPDCVGPQPAPAPVGEYPAKALEGVEPVACLVNADAGAMVWPISDIDEAGTYCDEGEFPELLYPAATVSALQARIAELESELRRVTTSPPTGSAPCARLCEHMAFQIQAKSDARRIAELEQDAARYRWLRANVEPVFARKHSEEFHDLNMKWQIKAYLTAVTAVGGDVPFDESIDAARKESK